MKKVCFLFLLTLFMVGCSDNADDLENGGIEGMSDELANWISENIHGDWPFGTILVFEGDYALRSGNTDAVSDYCSMVLNLDCGLAYGNYMYPSTKEEWDKMGSQEYTDLMNEYSLNKANFVKEAFVKALKSGYEGRVWPVFTTQYVDGEVSITCDKTLFGQAPGENLSKHFNVYYKDNSGTYDMPCIPVGIESPYILYGFNDSKPKRMDKVFVKDSWLAYGYSLVLNEEPNEKYDELTFTILLPSKAEETRSYFLAKLDGHGIPMSVQPRMTYPETCKVKFNWK